MDGEVLTGGEGGVSGGVAFRRAVAATLAGAQADVETEIRALPAL